MIGTAKKLAKQAAAIVRGDSVAAIEQAIPALAAEVDTLDTAYQAAAFAAASDPTAVKARDEAAAKLHAARTELSHKRAALEGAKRRAAEAEAEAQRTAKKAKAERTAALVGDLNAVLEMADDQLDELAASFKNVIRLREALANEVGAPLVNEDMPLSRALAHFKHRLQFIGFPPCPGMPRDASPRMAGTLPDAATVLRAARLLDLD